jgi:wyosine [tRNA(Phe)-imidazoG37] synthetase (radical SAM superfamily)
MVNKFQRPRIKEYLLTLLRFTIYYLLPRPLSRGVVAFNIFLGMVIKKQILGPRNIQISIPSGCDHDCVFCITDIHGKGAIHHREVMSFEDICKIIDSALEMCVLNVHFVSNGEPLLYPRIQELIDYTWAKSHGRCEIKIVTNGTSLKKNEHLNPQYLKSRNVVLWLSLHSGEFSVWSKIHRPKLNPEKKFEDLKEFLKAFNKLSPGSLTLHNVMCSLNYDHSESILKFALETGSKDISFGQLSKFDDLQITTVQEEMLVEKLNSLKSEFARHKIRTNINHFITVRSYLKKEAHEKLEENTSKELKSKTVMIKTHFYDENDCYISWLFSPIDDCGNVRSCGPGRFLGTVKKNSYKEIIQKGFPGFILESTQISKTKKNVKDCQCESCPHVPMNSIANHYLKKLTLK